MSDAVLSALCEEPEGNKLRNVYFLPLSLENLKKLWTKAQNFQTVFGQDVRGDFVKFASLLVEGKSIASLAPSGLFWVVDDFVGIFYLSRIIPHVEATAHYIFFDKRHKGRENLVMSMMLWAINTFDLQRVNVELPTYVSDNTKYFVEKHLGFKLEGRKRRAVQYRNAWFDVNLYGMLKEEALKQSDKWAPVIMKSEAVQQLA